MTICRVELPLQDQGGDTGLRGCQAVGIEVERRHLHRPGTFDDHGGLLAGGAAKPAGVDRQPIPAAGAHARDRGSRVHAGAGVGSPGGCDVDRCRQRAGAGVHPPRIAQICHPLLGFGVHRADGQVLVQHDDSRPAHARPRRRRRGRHDGAPQALGEVRDQAADERDLLTLNPVGASGGAGRARPSSVQPRPAPPEARPQARAAPSPRGTEGCPRGRRMWLGRVS